MARIRKKVHGRYYKILAYQILAGRLTNAQMARILGISERTYTDKIEGWTDFTGSQIRTMAEVLHVKQEELTLQE
jgi:hypothetical protein